MSQQRTTFEEVLQQCSPYLYFLCRGNQIPGMDFEDLQQELIVKLWECWRHYDSTKGVPFCTYAYPQLENRKNTLYRNACALKRGAGVQPVSLSEPMVRDQHGNEEKTLLQDTLYDTNSLIDAKINAMEMDDIVLSTMYSMSRGSQRIISLSLLGYSQREISQTVGCVQSCVSYHLQRFRQRLRTNLGCYHANLPLQYQ